MNIRHPYRLPIYSSDDIYYPRELIEIDGKLYIKNEDGTTTALNEVKKTTIQDSSGVEIGVIDPYIPKSIQIPDASTTRRGLVILGTAAAKAAGTASAGTSDMVSRQDHVHPAQTTISGNAGSATKLANARTINVSGAIIGTAQSFDGTKDIDIPVTSIDGSKITGIIPLTSIPKGAQEKLVHVSNDSARLALTIDTVQNGDVVRVESNGLMYYIEDETKLGTEAAFAVFAAGMASSVEWVNVQNKPTIYQPSTTAPKIAGIAAVGTSTTFARADHVHPAQTTISGNAGSATKATNDSLNQPIVGTYIKALSVLGTVITYTKGDGTTGTITTKDTTYNLATQETSGLLSPEDKIKLDGIVGFRTSYDATTDTVTFI